MAYEFEHAVSFINGTTVTQWATFMVKTATEVFFFKGFPVTSVSTHASAPTVTTSVNHDFLAGEKVAFLNVRSIAPDINAADIPTDLYTVGSSPGSSTFTIAANVTTAGAGGYVGRLLPGYMATEQVSSVRVGDKDDRRARDNTFY